MYEDEFEESSHDMLDEFGARFHVKLWDDAEKELYLGCSKYLKLSFTMRLMYVKLKNNRSVNSFNEVLHLFKDVLPVGTMSKSYYEAKMLKKGVEFYL